MGDKCTHGGVHVGGAEAETLVVGGPKMGRPEVEKMLEHGGVW